jgi:hypothetical protein
VPDAEKPGKFVRTDFYYTASWQLVEERQDDNLASKDTVASTLKYQYVWGLRYIDAPICRDEDTSDGSGGRSRCLRPAWAAARNPMHTKHFRAP